ncbi:MAG: hypothetical protein ACYCO9_03855 [Streptosporangiaceae bacterium]
MASQDAADARAAQIDTGGRRYVGRRYPHEVNLAGDADAALREFWPQHER